MRITFAIALVFTSCVHTPSADAEVEQGIADARRPRPAPSPRNASGSARLRQLYCPKALVESSWDQMLDCADYEDSAGDRRNAAKLWLKVAAVGASSDQRCLALSRLERRTDGRFLELVPPSTLSECRSAFHEQAAQCETICTGELASCQDRQRDVALANGVRTVVAAFAWAEGSLLGDALSDELLANRVELPRCGAEFNACYRSCTIVR
jgi:hypothetical protein